MAAPSSASRRPLVGAPWDHPVGALRRLLRPLVWQPPGWGGSSVGRFTRLCASSWVARHLAKGNAVTKRIIQLIIYKYKPFLY
jgi:hypothetical protein